MKSYTMKLYYVREPWSEKFEQGEPPGRGGFLREIIDSDIGDEIADLVPGRYELRRGKDEPITIIIPGEKLKITVQEVKR